jgi:uncharacterized protein YyaL (SSP411 family)
VGDSRRAACPRAKTWRVETDGGQAKATDPFAGGCRQAHVHLHAWILTSGRSQAVIGHEFFRTITEEILDYVVRETTCVDASFDTEQFRRAPKLHSNATDQVGGVAFYSTQDADSEREEDEFFVWTQHEPVKVLAHSPSLVSSGPSLFGR